MIFGSCHFLCHQFTQRDESNQIIADMDALTALSAALVWSADIDCLNQLVGRVGREFRQLCVSDRYSIYAENSPRSGERTGNESG